MSFVQKLLDHTKDYESSTSFWTWSAYSVIGATLKDRCYRKLGDFKVYPNIYTLLLAPSAVHRKGNPVVLANQLLKDIKATKLIVGRASIQGILDELASADTDRKTGKINLGGQAIFLAEEFSAGIVNDPEAIKILTDIYTFKDDYQSRLRSGTFNIKNICFSMLVASNEDIMRDFYSDQAIYGGLLGRTFLVKPNEFRPGNSLWETPDRAASYQNLIDELIFLKTLEGEFDVEKKAQQVYDEWYVPFRKSYENKADRSGISGRIHTSVLKLAMIICADESKSLNITAEHVKKSIDQCVSLLPNYQSFSLTSGKSDIAEVAASFVESIWLTKDKSIEKSEFLRKNYHLYDLDLLDRCIKNLVNAEIIRPCINGDMTKEHYILTAKGMEKFNLK